MFLEKIMYKEKGITLIALVVTIVVLLVIGGISLNLILGEDGITKRALDSKNAMEEAQIKEIIKLAYQEAYIENFTEEQPNHTETRFAELMKNALENQYGEGNVYVAYHRDGNYTVIIQNTQYLMDSEGNITVKEYSDVPEGFIELGTDVIYIPTGTYNWEGKYATSYPETEDESGNKVIKDNNGVDFTNRKLATGFLATTGTTNVSVNTWKVLKVDEENNKVILVPNFRYNEEESLRLHGAQGYNNAVNLLDEACSSLYGNSSKGITAENIDMELIEGLMREVEDEMPEGTEDSEKIWKTVKESYTNANPTYSHLDDNNQVKNAYSTSKSIYPVVYAEEMNGLGTSGKTASKIERSAGTSLTNLIGAVTNASTGIKPYQTYYTMGYSDFSTALGKYASVILPNDNLTPYYWIASRSVGTGANYCRYCVYTCDGGKLSTTSLIYSNGSGVVATSRYLFPVVTLSTDLIKLNKVTGMCEVVQ